MAEGFTGQKGKYVKREKTIAGCEAILNGDLDKVPEGALLYIGEIEEAFKKVKS